MFSKTFATFLSASFALHTVFAAAVYYPQFLQAPEESPLTEIQYFPAPAKKTVTALEAPKAPEPALKPVPVAALPAPAAKKAAPAVPAKKTAPKVPARVSQERAAIRKSVPAPALQRSEDLLADPKNGKIFAAYFARIKEKIQVTVQRKYAYESIGGGSVTLLFVLKPDGSLDSVSALEKQSTGGGEVRGFAVRCVRDSAPFGAFPKDLGPGRISFNITMHFEEV